MELRGITLEQFKAITAEVSESVYDGNVIVQQDAHDVSGKSCRGRLRVKDSRGPGARTSWTGRRTPSTCWHAYRDVLAALFERYPDATIKTMMAVYRGKDGFHDLYPDTAYHNIGSQWQPAYVTELCEC